MRATVLSHFREAVRLWGFAGADDAVHRSSIQMDRRLPALPQALVHSCLFPIVWPQGLLCCKTNDVKINCVCIKFILINFFILLQRPVASTHCGSMSVYYTTFTLYVLHLAFKATLILKCKMALKITNYWLMVKEIGGYAWMLKAEDKK